MASWQKGSLKIGEIWPQNHKYWVRFSRVTLTGVIKGAYNYDFPNQHKIIFQMMGHMTIFWKFSKFLKFWVALRWDPARGRHQNGATRFFHVSFLFLPQMATLDKWAKKFDHFWKITSPPINVKLSIISSTIGPLINKISLVRSSVFRSSLSFSQVSYFDH